MSELTVGILGFVCIVAIVITLFKSKTMPSMAFIIFPSILGLILVLGRYYTIGEIGDLIKGGFKSTGPTAALFVFSVLFFGIMTDAGMFDVIIDKLMKYVGDNVIGVTVMTAVIALIGHLDGGGASTFLIVVPSMLPVYKKMHMRPTTLLRVAVLAMGVLNLMPWAGPTMRAASVLGMEAGQLWDGLIPIQIFGIILCLAHAVFAGVQEKKRGAGLNGKLAMEASSEDATEEVQHQKDENEYARPKLFAFISADYRSYRYACMGSVPKLFPVHARCGGSSSCKLYTDQASEEDDQPPCGSGAYDVLHSDGRCSPYGCPCIWL